jgi:hypothetical protein
MRGELNVARNETERRYSRAREQKWATNAKENAAASPAVRLCRKITPSTPERLLY